RLVGEIADQERGLGLARIFVVLMHADPPGRTVNLLRAGARPGTGRRAHATGAPTPLGLAGGHLDGLVGETAGQERFADLAWTVTVPLHDVTSGAASDDGRRVAHIGEGTLRLVPGGHLDGLVGETAGQERLADLVNTIIVLLHDMTPLVVSP